MAIQTIETVKTVNTHYITLKSGKHFEEPSTSPIHLSKPILGDLIELRKRQVKSQHFQTQLLVPDVQYCNQSKRHQSRFTKLSPYTQFASSYFDYRSSAEPWLASSPEDRSKLEKRSKGELQSIEAVIPHLEDPAEVLCLAAFFSCSCSVDDLVETMTPNAGIQALKDAYEICRKDQNIEEESNALWNRDGPDSWSSSSNTNSSAAAKIRFLSKAFRRYVSLVLGDRKQISALCDGMCDWLDAEIEETIYRDRNVTPSLTDYLVLREKTIGVSPLFRILAARRQISKPECQTSSLSPALKRLAGLTDIVLGLQNDVMGLEKDLVAGEVFNYVVIAAKPQLLEGAVSEEAKLSHIQQSLHSAAAEHNRAVESAAREWETLRREGGTTLEEFCLANSMLESMSLHIGWAAKVKRYQVQ